MSLGAHYLVEQATLLADFLVSKSGLSKAKIKECMEKGGVWVRGDGRKELRYRKAKTQLRPGDRVSLYYDEGILGLTPTKPRLIADHLDYSVWDKPPGVLAQGTQFADHCSLLRLAQLAFSPPREVFLIHRLDREASGLMVIAHNRRAAAALSSLFQGHLLSKHYQITVRGLWQEATGSLRLPLDGKVSVTGFQLLDRDEEGGVSRLLINLQTGRFHQIRRHFAAMGFPVMGDPRYGRGNKNRTGLALRAVRLAFDCPLSGQRRDFQTGESFDFG